MCARVWRARASSVAAADPRSPSSFPPRSPMKRCGTITEISELVAFVASKACSFTTGFTFDATGGRATY